MQLAVEDQEIPVPPMPDVSINVKLPNHVHTQLKVWAAQRGLTVKEAVIEAIEGWCA
jgi:hypothetical protein